MESLLERGWIRNWDFHSPCFDLKFATARKNIPFSYLQPYQIVNHFEDNHYLTQKSGLCKTLHLLTNHRNDDIDQFFPKCFDLREPNDIDDFILQFKLSKTISILRKLSNNEKPNLLLVVKSKVAVVVS